MSVRREWSRDEELFLKNNFSHMSIHDICKQLDRKIPSVTDKAYRLGLKGGTYSKKEKQPISKPKRSGFAWGKKETDNLIKWYSRAGAKRIADKTDRTELEVTQKAKQLGLN